jgi:hypothetical protein
MSKPKPIEFRSPPKSVGGDAISISVRFNYPGGGTWRGILTMHAETREEIKERLREAYDDKRPRPQVRELVSSMKDITEMDLDEE